MNLVIMEQSKLGEGLLHFVDSAGAVDELDGVLGLGEGVAGDERKEGDGLAGAGGHLEKTMALGVESSLQLKHVRVLLRVYVIVREVHCYVLQLKLHRACSAGDELTTENQNDGGGEIPEVSAQTPMAPSLPSSPNCFQLLMQNNNTILNMRF